jgi:hypothetical protein
MYNQQNDPRAAPASTIDAYALFEALTGKKIPRDNDSSASSSKTMSEDYDDLQDWKEDNNLGREPQPDQPPKDSEINVGAINPYALVEALIGHKLDRRSSSSARIISDVLQTDYDELFDLKHESVLYAGLKLNQEHRRAEQLREQDVRVLEERDLVTPDLSRVQRLNDLERVGLKQLGETRVKTARIRNGKLRIVLDANSLARTISNHEVTQSLNDLSTRYRREKGKDNKDQKGQQQWTPPNSTWRDINEVVQQVSVQCSFHSPSRWWSLDSP